MPHVTGVGRSIGRARLRPRTPDVPHRPAPNAQKLEDGRERDLTWNPPGPRGPGRADPALQSFNHPRRQAKKLRNYEKKNVINHSSGKISFVDGLGSHQSDVRRVPIRWWLQKSLQNECYSQG